MARVKLPTILRSHAGGEKQVDVDGATLREVLSDLETRYPGITITVLTEDGALHRFVNVYVNDEDVRVQNGLATAVGAGDTVVILPAMAGGDIPRRRRRRRHQHARPEGPSIFPV